VFYFYLLINFLSLAEKVKKVKVTTFQTVEEIFKIEFTKPVTAQIDEKIVKQHFIYNFSGILVK
jgi:hypothetical protein